ncbi:hypothetical protein [Paenibacillus sp. P13VS]|uniref:hypothetical protein n=1 Tax=Paenibacillus sp. P13VS TaxID=2697367 RepID=UPI00187B639E|nr:hypothetical protein [Paenibacillus sp. P13VS]MBE7682207.1 hypothetical protein [Paenibacillus sp. P13VS]
MDLNEIEEHIRSEYNYMLTGLNYNINQAVERILSEQEDYYRMYSNNAYKHFIKILYDLCSSDENKNKGYVFENLKKKYELNIVKSTSKKINSFGGKTSISLNDSEKKVIRKEEKKETEEKDEDFTA